MKIFSFFTPLTLKSISYNENIFNRYNEKNFKIDNILSLLYNICMKIFSHEVYNG